MPKRGVAPKRRHQILEATFDCMAQKGYGNFSLKDVADKATLSKGIIHYYFKNKGELLILVLDRLTQTLDNLVNEKANRAKNPPGRIRAIFDGTFEAVSEREPFFQVLLDFCAQASKNKEIKEITARLYTKYRQLTQKVIENGIRHGVFRQLDVQEVSTVIVGMAFGISFQYMLDENAFSLPKVEKICEALILSYLEKPQ